ncbi:cytochrome P450 CYP82D47-like [Nymphaea colorata]|uniref:cytochrome P450 CYP82D47-like n=1 Tax=Nymphaea colorata TaxID=210225 RepID=UPI00129EB3A9|nr:cytochrome P450 CYP82D47-like [Nymphaea colorata]
MDSVKLVESLAAFLALVFLYHIWPKRKGETKRRPTEPGGAWPVVGHLRLLTGTTPLHRTLAALSEKHGPLFTLRLGQMRALVVGSMDLAKECFTTNDQAFASRPPLESSKCLGYGCAMLGLAPYGPYWREVRKITTIELLSNRRLDLLKHIRVEEVGSLVEALYRSCAGDYSVDINRLFSNLSMNIVLRMVAGKRYFNLDGEENDGDEEEFRKVISEFFHLLGVLTVSDAIPCLEWLDVGGHLKDMKRVKKKMDGFASAWLAEHRRERKSGRRDTERDFIDVLIKEVEDDHLSKKHQTDTIIEATAMSLVAAGTDTTSVTLEWALSAMLNNRQVLEKAKEELDCKVGRERQVEESDIKNLAYLQAILKETMRLYPAVPLLVPHQSIEPIHLGGYHIPTGTTLFVNTWKIHRDPMLWTDPEEFRPERFLTSDKEIGFGGQNFAFMPFGMGRRMCPGWTMALQVLHLTLARLLQSFEWSMPMDEPVDMTEGFGLTMPKAAPLKVRLTPRLPPHLY